MTWHQRREASRTGNMYISERTSLHMQDSFEAKLLELLIITSAFVLTFPVKQARKRRIVEREKEFFYRTTATLSENLTLCLEYQEQRFRSFRSFAPTVI